MAKLPADKLHAWLLHSRPFRENSLLLDFLTLERGRFSAISRGARGSKSVKKAILQPFTALHISVVGKGELQTLKDVEAPNPGMSLTGEALFAAMYVNELVVKLLSGHESEPELFTTYTNTLHALATGSELEIVLRRFELALLDSLGYALNLHFEAEEGCEILPEGQYYLQPDLGFIRLQGDFQAGSTAHVLFPGADLLAIAEDDFAEISTRRFAKILMRQLLAHHLGEKTLSSRALFISASR